MGERHRAEGAAVLWARGGARGWTRGVCLVVAVASAWGIGCGGRALPGGHDADADAGGVADADGDADADVDVDADTDADGDADADEDVDVDADDDGDPDGSVDAAADADAEADSSTDADGTADADGGQCEPVDGVTREQLDSCIASHGGCGCSPGCEDGFWDVLWHREEDGPFPADIFPPPELLAVAIAHYSCAVCSCEESWRVREGSSWVEVGACEMCNHVLSTDVGCGGCLIEWMGGCC